MRKSEMLGLALFLLSANALFSCASRAAVAPPRQRLARSLSGEQVARAVQRAPSGAKISVPEHGLRPWSASRKYSAGDTCSLAGAVYACIQSHASLPGWEPPAVPALWRLVRAATDAPGRPPAWRQPQGAHDAYRKGDRVTHNGKTWTSTIDANVWAPGVYGWAAD